MKVGALTAEADLLGGRVRARWTVARTPGDPEPVFRLRRKTRDFTFPPLSPGEDDPYAVLDGPLEALGAVRTFALPPGPADAVEVASVLGSGSVELLRVTRRTTGDVVEVEVLDPGPDGRGLAAGRPLYYELGWEPPGRPGELETRQAVAVPTARGSGGAALWELLPDVLRRHDVVPGPERAEWAGIPERGTRTPDSVDPRERAGQLRRLLDVVGAGVDHLRSRADGLRDLRDVDAVDARLLPHLAAWVGWDLGWDRPVPARRHEIRYAAKLYGLTGTVPGVAVWTKRLTDWDVDVQEFWRNVFVTNDTGNPDDPRDAGSRTVDTADAALLASLGGRDDRGDYTYDTSPQGRYAFDKVGLFVEPTVEDGAGGRRTEPAVDVLRKRARLLRSTDRFLPVNMRAVVVVGGTDEVTDDVHLGVTAGTEDAHDETDD